VLQEREFERLGSMRTLRIDVRLIAATNRDLKTMVEGQKFRSDLYYRLNVFPIRVPALRERKEDIPLLVRHFVQEFSRRNNRVIDTIPSETMQALVRYHWPGNIRELQNVIEPAVIISRGPVLNVALAELTPDATSISAPVVTTAESAHRESLREMLEETERNQILRARNRRMEWSQDRTGRWLVWERSVRRSSSECEKLGSGSRELQLTTTSKQRRELSSTKDPGARISRGCAPGPQPRLYPERRPTQANNLGRRAPSPSFLDIAGRLRQPCASSSA
jgi:transcriptional regulator with GAF, ATPase, and Fis domain